MGSAGVGLVGVGAGGLTAPNIALTSLVRSYLGVRSGFASRLKCSNFERGIWDVRYIK